eukprot:4160961-Pleurochrysis_carterae.AAC.3
MPTSERRSDDHLLWWSMLVRLMGGSNVDPAGSERQPMQPSSSLRCRCLWCRPFVESQDR